MANNVTKDLGAVTAYAAAVAAGYTGTKAEFEALMADYASVEERAQDYAEDSEAYAKGTRGGSPVGSSDPAYHNNAEYFKDLANSQGAAQAQNAEAYANGTRGGTPVSSDDPAYHNNSKHWKEQAQSITQGQILMDSNGYFYVND